MTASSPPTDPEHGTTGQPANDVQGEGSYAAAERYRSDTERFIEREGEAGIEANAEQAAAALDGEESDELARAEAAARAPARD